MNIEISPEIFWDLCLSYKEDYKRLPKNDKEVWRVIDHMIYAYRNNDFYRIKICENCGHEVRKESQ